MLSEKQEQAIHLLVYENKTQRQVAEILGLHESTVSRWRHNEEYVKRFKEEIENKFSSLVSKAITRMENVLDNNNNYSAALNAAKYILDYYGFKAVDKVEQVNETTIKVTLDDMEGCEDAADKSTY